MSNSTIISVNTLLNKAVKSLNLMSLGQEKKPQTAGINESVDLIDVKDLLSQVDSNDINDAYSSIKDKMLDHHVMSNYQPHLLHYAIKSFGYLPTPVLESLIGCLKGPTSKQYMHVDAHLRLILAVNSKLKTPLQLIEMTELRKRFAADAVAMQAPKVWQQASDTLFSNIKPFTKKSERAISWEDKFKYDFEYVNNISFLGDLKIILQTVLKVFQRADINAKNNVTIEEFRGSK